MREFQQRTYHYMEYEELDRLIQEVYGNTEYECVPDNEWNNYSAYPFNITKREISEWSREDIEKFKNGESVFPSIHWLLVDMCNRDIIPEGWYLINVSW